jgi:hypothetical protein
MALGPGMKDAEQGAATVALASARQSQHPEGDAADDGSVSDGRTAGDSLDHEIAGIAWPVSWRCIYA